MKKINKEKVKKVSLDMLFIMVGCAVGAYANHSILVANGLTSGGITGVARTIQKFTDLNFSTLYYGMVLIIVIVCAILLGLKEARKILPLSIIYPSFLILFENIDLAFLQEKDIFLAAIYCGIFFGICNGLVFSRGYSFGGTDTVAKIIQKKLIPHISISKILLVIDACVIILGGIIFGINIALYALLTQVILSKTIEFVMFGFESKVVQIEIITDMHDEVAEFIMSDINRGVTNVTVTGEYSKIQKEKIITLCSPRETFLIKQFVAKTDHQAFVTVIHVDTVWGKGEGFYDITK